MLYEQAADWVSNAYEKEKEDEGLKGKVHRSVPDASEQAAGAAVRMGSVTDALEPAVMGPIRMPDFSASLTVGFPLGV